MEHAKNAMELLEANTCPTFCVQNGSIVYTNEAAKLRQIEVGTKIHEILTTGIQEYTDFSGGCLYLSLNIAESQYCASVYRMEEFDVFRLDQDADQPELQAMALAARELREPLASIMTVAERLFPNALTQDSPAAQEQIAQLNRGLYQMLRIISNMSDAARYEKSAPAVETIDIAGVFDEVMEKASELASQADLSLSYSGISDSVLTLASQEKIERAVYNLLSNAIKFSLKGSTIEAKLKKQGKLLYFTVQDSGQGIPSTMRSTVFSRFLREPGVEDGLHGIGLGMVLVRSAAVSHGGTVLIEQPEGKGARVTMTIKLSQNNSGVIRSNVHRVDYLGERDHGLVELSERLPASAYQDIN